MPQQPDQTRASAPLSQKDLDDYERLSEEMWRAEGVSEEHIRLSRLNGMDAKDIATIARLTRAPPIIIVIRCPKATAHALHRVIGRAKPLIGVVSESDGRPAVVGKLSKTDSDGVLRQAGREYTSDYDLMGVWKLKEGGKPHRLKISPKDKPPPQDKETPWKGGFTLEATEFIRRINFWLKVKLQHGCQDDMHSQFNPGIRCNKDVKVENDHFTGFRRGVVKYLGDMNACRDYYKKHELTWQYGPNGQIMEEYTSRSP